MKTTQTTFKFLLLLCLMGQSMPILAAGDQQLTIEQKQEIQKKLTAFFHNLPKEIQKYYKKLKAEKGFRSTETILYLYNLFRKNYDLIDQNTLDKMVKLTPEQRSFVRKKLGLGVLNSIDKLPQLEDNETWEMAIEHLYSKYKDSQENIALEDINKNLNTLKKIIDERILEEDQEADSKEIALPISNEQKKENLQDIEEQREEQSENDDQQEDSQEFNAQSPSGSDSNYVSHEVNNITHEDTHKNQDSHEVIGQENKDNNQDEELDAVNTQVDDKDSEQGPQALDDKKIEDQEDKSNLLTFAEPEREDHLALVPYQAQVAVSDTKDHLEDQDASEEKAQDMVDTIQNALDEITARHPSLAEARDDLTQKLSSQFPHLPHSLTTLATAWGVYTEAQKLDKEVAAALKNAFENLTSKYGAILYPLLNQLHGILEQEASESLDPLDQETDNNLALVPYKAPQHKDQKLELVIPLNQKEKDFKVNPLDLRLNPTLKDIMILHKQNVEDQDTPLQNKSEIQQNQPKHQKKLNKDFDHSIFNQAKNNSRWARFGNQAAKFLPKLTRWQKAALGAAATGIGAYHVAQDLSPEQTQAMQEQLKNLITNYGSAAWNMIKEDPKASNILLGSTAGIGIPLLKRYLSADLEPTQSKDNSPLTAEALKKLPDSSQKNKTSDKDTASITTSDKETRSIATSDEDRQSDTSEMPSKTQKLSFLDYLKPKNWFKR